jgi:hypothetical protein
MIHPPVKCARDVTDEESDFLWETAVLVGMFVDCGAI